MNASNAPNVGLFGPRNPAWRGDEVSYVGAHARVWRVRGSPRSHMCEMCENPAAEWAYDHRDPRERRSPRGYPYSPDPGHYRPLCIPCHRREDWSRRRASQDRGPRFAV